MRVTINFKDEHKELMELISNQSAAALRIICGIAVDNYFDQLSVMSDEDLDELLSELKDEPKGAN